MENFDKLLCEKTLTRAKVAKFRDAIKGEFEYEMAFSGRLLQSMMGRVDDTDESRPRYYLVTHLRFYPLYTGNQVKRLIVSEDFDSDVDTTEDVEIKVKFTYSVLWMEVRMRHDTYEFLPAQSWNSILSLMFWPSAVFFLFGLLLLLPLAPYFTANFTGAFILFILAYNRRMLSLDTILLVFCLTSVVSGYKAVAFHVKFTRLGWKECIFLAGNLYFIPVCLTVFSVNIVAQINFGELEIAEFGESFNVLMACGIFTGALSTLGGMIVYCSKEKTSEVPCPTRTTTAQREIHPQPWYRNTLAQMFLGSLPPFIYILPSMDNIYASLMNLTICNAFHTLISSLSLIIGWTVMLAIGFACLIDLSKKDYRWWWRSVLRGGSTAIYMFFYSIYFAYKLDIEGPLLVVYLGYNVGIFYALFLILGTISFYASLINHHDLEKNE